MKKLLIFCSLITIHYSLFSQSWLWGVDGIGALKTNDNGTPVATDKSGNVYMTGNYETTITFGTITLNDLYSNAYVVKYNSAGTVQWAVQPAYSKGSGSWAHSIAVDNSGNIYITGYFKDTITFGSFRLVSASSISAAVFIAKYSSSGNVLWARQSIEPAKYCYGVGNSICIDNKNNAYVTGSFNDTINLGSFTLNSSSTNVFLAKYDSNGNVMWVRQSMVSSIYSYGSGSSCITDKGGNIYLAGEFIDTIAFNSYTLISSSKQANTFTAKYDTGGNLQWVKQPVLASAASNDYPFSDITDENGDVYITGVFYDTVNFGSYQLISGNYFGEMFLAKYGTKGDLIWAEQSLGSYYWVGCSLSADALNHIYLAGCGGNDSVLFAGIKLTSTSVNPSFIMELDTSGKAICGSMLYDGGSSFANGPVSCASDALGTHIYTGGTFYNDSIFCGPDTLIVRSGGEWPYIARWQPCFIPIDTIPNLTGQEPCANLFIPDAFSPNGDGQNDMFFIKSDCLKTMELTIFDRWGNKVFESQNINNGWDGNYTGKPMYTGTYVYYLKATMQDGSAVEKHGNITLVR